MGDTVKCANCGFLAVRKIETRELVDAEDETRDNGHLAVTPHGHRPIYDGRLICFVQAFPLIKETGPNPGAPERKTVAQKERRCERFVEWRQGFTPKEHQEMIDRERQQKREDDRDESQRNFLAGQARQTNRHNLRMFALTIVGILVALFLGLWGGKSKPPVGNVNVPSATYTSEPAVPPPVP